MATKAKKAPAKKATVKRAAAKKAAPPARKTSARKAPAKKEAAGAEKATARKTSAKKAPAKKVAARGPTPKKAAPSKTAAKKPALKKPAAKKAVAGKAAPKRAPAAPAASIESSAPVVEPIFDYDPRAQLDKLTEGRGDTVRTTRSSAPPAAPAVDVNAVLGHLFGLRKDEPLTLELLEQAAQELGVEAAALRAIAEVESRGSGFDAKGRPTVLYERHVFARNTTPKGRFNAEHPDISASTGYPRGGYGNTESQWNKLARAYQLDEEAALKAPSWGTFQILGENHRASGFADVRAFVDEIFTSPAGHLRALVRFIKANPGIHQGLKVRNWEAVARGYNGRDYKTFEYDTKLAAAYAKYAAA